MRVEYAGKGNAGPDINPFVRKERRTNAPQEIEDMKMPAGEDMAGGFFQPGHEEEEVLDRGHTHASQNDDEGGGFLVEDKMDVDEDIGGCFLVEDEADAATTSTKATRSVQKPVSLQSMHKLTKGSADSEPETTTSKALSRSNPLKSRANKTKGKLSAPQPKPKQSKSRRTKQVISDDEDESPLSELPDDEESDSQDAGETSDSDDVITTPARTKHVSPEVIITNGSRSHPRATKKVTPTRSQYFNHSEGEDAIDIDEVEEVIQPRKTTARTRARK